MLTVLKAALAATAALAVLSLALLGDDPLPMLVGMAPLALLAGESVWRLVS
jgi:hypothetical protein